MIIFVTVGTTKFDVLIEYIDKLAAIDNNEYIFQIGSGNYKPKNGKYFDFTKDIDGFYHDSGLVITHAGAGSIYRLLEMKQNVLVVPNLSRIDDHQKDIAMYMEDNNHLLVSWDFNDISKKIELSKKYNPDVYVKDCFFKNQEISDYINRLL